MGATSSCVSAPIWISCMTSSKAAWLAACSTYIAAEYVANPSSKNASSGVAGLTRHRHHWCEISDRKSTRLNSSHLVISYAVFCLKKKKIKRVQRHHTYRER